MPNWVYNSLHAIGSPSEVSRFVRRMKTENSEFDFNAIAPCHPDLMNATSGWSKDEATMAKWKREHEANLAKHGYATWYDFCCEEWGTKWNAREIEIDFFEGCKAVHVNFTTAWDTPRALMEKISREFPTLEFEVESHNEDSGIEGERITYKGGNIVSEVEIPNINAEEEAND